MNKLLREKLNLEAVSIQGLLDENTQKELRIVAEGDSWFDYPLVRDVIDHLRKMGYFIAKRSSAGDTLENMVFGSEFKIKRKEVYNFGPRDIQETMTSIRAFKPRFVLFSGGGNDIVGKELSQYLFHRSLTDNVLREEVFNDNLEKFIKPAIKTFCDFVWNIDPEIDILMDGYDYAKPNGKSYAKIAGPWLLPTFGAKAITIREDQEDIIRILIDKFNELLRDFGNTFENFHHVDLRGMFPKDNQWHNEIHLKGREYKKVAIMYRDKMRSLVEQE